MGIFAVSVLKFITDIVDIEAVKTWAKVSDARLSIPHIQDGLSATPGCVSKCKYDMSSKHIHAPNARAHMSSSRSNPKHRAKTTQARQLSRIKLAAVLGTLTRVLCEPERSRFSCSRLLVAIVLSASWARDSGVCHRRACWRTLSSSGFYWLP